MITERTAPDAIARLRRTHRRRRAVALLYAASAMLLALHMRAAEAHGRWANGDTIAVAMAALGAAILIGWLSRQRGQTLAASARTVDAKLGLQSRCEAACELAGDDTRIAVALRTDVGRRLEGRSLPGAFSWYAACTVLGVAVLLAVIEVSLPSAPRPVAARSPTPRTNATTEATDSREVSTPVKPPAQPAPAVAVPAATLQWISPAVVVEAGSVAELALAARTTAAVPVGSATLQVFINGSPAGSVPLDDQALQRFTEGALIETILYLDEFPLREADVVGYRLTALRRDDPGQSLVSPMQFVIVSNLNEPVGPPADIRRLRELRADVRAQVGLLAEVLNPVEATGATVDAQRLQHELAQRVQALRDELMPQPAAQPLVDAVWQMRRAENHIANREPVAAAERQYGALNGLRTAQLLQLEAMRAATAGIAPRIQPRHETPAGKLEEVAKRQRQIAEKLSEPDPLLAPPEADASESAREGTREPDESAAKRVRSKEPAPAESQDGGDDPVQDRAGGNRSGSAQGEPAGRLASPESARHAGEPQSGSGTLAGRPFGRAKNESQPAGGADLVGRMGQVTRALQELQGGRAARPRARCSRRSLTQRPPSNVPRRATWRRRWSLRSLPRWRWTRRQGSRNAPE